MSGELVPFGKHKGQPVEVLVADPGYREWVLAQPWVRDRYPTFHQTIINYAGEPADTPEHNQLQASFLDDGRCLGLARALLPDDTFDGRQADRLVQRDERYAAAKQHVSPKLEEARVRGRKFEADGWDVIFRVRPAALFLELRSLPSCPCACDHEADCPASSTCRGGDQEHRCGHRHYAERAVQTLEWQRAATLQEIERWLASDHHAHGHCDRRCPWRSEKTTRWLLDDEERLYEPASRTIRVECKPDLGDDFPAVLRQVTRYDTNHGDRCCVVVRRYATEHVSWAQAVEMFRASGVTLVPEALLAAEAPAP